ncbi:hypothetical protein ACR03S_13205 [Limimaricola variabilis]
MAEAAFGLQELRFVDGETEHENLFLWSALERPLPVSVAETRMTPACLPGVIEESA